MRTQEIELRKSEIREKLANIEFAEATDDQKTEARALTKEFADLEVEYRAALITETEERAALEDEAKKAESKEDEFDVECRAFSIRAATMGSLGEGLTGREKEVSEELEQRDGEAREGGIRVPWAALLTDEIEQRSDAAVTTTGAAALFTRPNLQPVERLFAASAAAMFGARQLTVSGAPRLPEITAGKAPAWVSEGAGTDAAAITVVGHAPAVHTLASRYLISRQSLLTGRLQESLLRADLGMAIAEALDAAFFQGTGTDPQPSGLAGALTATDHNGLPDFADWIKWAMDLYESSKMAGSNARGMLSGICFAMNPGIFALPASSTVTSGAAYGPTETQALSEIGIKMIHSPQVGALQNSAAKHAGDVFAYANDGRRAHAHQVLWGSPEIIADPYTSSKTAQVALTIFAFADIILTRKSTHFKRYEVHTIT